MENCSNCGRELAEDSQFCPYCGTPVSQPEQSGGEGQGPMHQTEVKSGPSYGAVDVENLPAGHVLDERYEVQEKLGHGGFGAVYRAYDRKMDIDKALKVLPAAVASDREAMENLLGEARTMARLNHPNIVRVYEIRDQGPVKYLDMEYVSGGSLADLKYQSK